MLKSQEGYRPEFIAFTKTSITSIGIIIIIIRIQPVDPYYASH